ncbi:MAG TPA: hypothetical protein VK705_05660 [Ferruginibacter sp.]|nr:hypothetical protein [Ferruginibacter sp.]
METKLNKAIIALPEVQEKLNSFFNFLESKHGIKREECAFTFNPKLFMYNTVDSKIQEDLDNELNKIFNPPL